MKWRFFIFGLIWILFVSVAIVLDYVEHREMLSELFKEKALSLLDKDLAYRNWASGHGGVYVPITNQVRPNEYLGSILKDRDIPHPDGRTLTLINPARMTRETNELLNRTQEVQTRLISDKPIVKENILDQWETVAFEKVRIGNEVYYELVSENRSRQFRVIRGLRVTESCLKCHSKQDYKIGDLRGAISIKFPVEKHYQKIEEREFVHFLSMIISGLFGIGLLFYLYRGSSREIKEKEIAIRNKRVLETILENIKEIIFVDDLGAISEANEAFYEIFACKGALEYRQKRILFDSHILPTEKETLPPYIDGVRWVDHCANLPEASHKIKLKIGESIYTYSVVAKRVEALGAGRILVLLHDISALEQKREELELLVKFETEKRRESEAILMQQMHFTSISELLRNISHHWRQPLHVAAMAIQSAEEMVEEQKLDREIDDFKQMMKTAQEKIFHLSTTIDRFSKIFGEKSGRGEFDVAGMIKSVAEFLRPQFKDQNLEFYLDLKTSLCWGSPAEFEQILLNLLYNAADAIREEHPISERGTIHIKNEKLNKSIRISIQDNGGGVPNEIIDRVFEPYFTTRSDGKHPGLGLYMVKMVIEKQFHGQIGMRNEGAGVLVTIELPIDLDK